MLSLPKFLYPSVLSVDISPDAVTILSLSLLDKKYSIEAYGSAVLPPQSIKGHLIDDIDAIAYQIKHLIGKTKRYFKYAVLAIPEAATMSKMIQINSNLREQALEEAVLNEIKNYIPYPLDEINIDFHMLGSALNQPSMVDVFVIASKIEYIENRVAIAKRAGLGVKAIDVELYAIQRAIRLLILSISHAKNSRVIAFCALYARRMQFIILQDMSILFSRSEAFYADSDDPIAYKTWALEQIQHAFQFFFSNHAIMIEQLVVMGNITNLSDMVECLEEQLTIPVGIVNPLESISLGGYVHPPHTIKDNSLPITALGLALRQV